MALSPAEIEEWKRRCTGCWLADDSYCSLNHGEFWCPIRLDALSDDDLDLELAEGRIDAEVYGWAVERRAMMSVPRSSSFTSQLIRQSIQLRPHP